MPLEIGIDSFNDHHARIDTNEKVLTAFFDAREEILAVFRNNPPLAMEPYAYCSNSYVGCIVPLEIPINNPIYEAILSQDLVQFGPDIVEASGWFEIAETIDSFLEEDVRIYSESFALIDMACYLVYLLNIYQPNRALIQNLVSTHSRVDALGRENLVAIKVALEKLIKKMVVHVPGYFDGCADQAAALVVIARHDAGQNNQFRISSPGIDFERVCETRLTAGGFEVQITPATGDFGADIIALKDDLGYAIQCKDTSKPVGVKAVQEAVAARSHYKVDFAVVCASAGFTDAAIELATSNRVLLCNADQLVKRLDSV
jgi:Restriction endonuclease